MAFNEIIGHSTIIRSLQNSLRKDKISHAYLFFGPDGIGKKLIAFSLAKAINCIDQDGDFCGFCDSCRRIENGVHPDLFFIEPEGQSIKIDQLRDLQASTRYKPYMAKRKVCIIDQVDRMTASAANSILKTLEEPPGTMVIILLAAYIDQILPTVRSRCQLLQFSPLSTGDVERLIIDKMALPQDKAHLLASFAAGSFGKAQYLDPAILEEKNKKILFLIEHLYTLKIEEIFTEAKKLAEEKNSENLQHLLALWIYWYYDIWKYKLTGNEQNLTNSNQIGHIHQQSQLLSYLKIKKNIQLIQNALSALQRNANKQLTMEVMLMKLSTHENRISFEL